MFKHTVLVGALSGPVRSKNAATVQFALGMSKVTVHKCQAANHGAASTLATSLPTAEHVPSVLHILHLLLYFPMFSTTTRLLHVVVGMSTRRCATIFSAPSLAHHHRRQQYYVK